MTHNFSISKQVKLLEVNRTMHYVDIEGQHCPTVHASVNNS